MKSETFAQLVAKYSNKDLTLFCDGGARGNPGPAAGGVVLQCGEQVLVQIGQFLDTRTNNQAEYLAVVLGIEKALLLAPTSLTIYLDSQLIVKQMTGEYKIRDATLREIASGIVARLGSCPVHWHHIPREQNSAADAMANYAMDHGEELGQVFYFFGENV